MDDRRMTAQEWSNIYGWESARRGARFWLLLVFILIAGAAGGAALGLFVLPGVSVARAASAADADHLAEMEQRIAEFEEQFAQQEAFRAALDKELEQVAAESDNRYVVNDTFPAMGYTVQVSASEQCADLLAVQQNGDVSIFQFRSPYPCNEGAEGVSP
jgi:Tfp pilus assembly protein PilN